MAINPSLYKSMGFDPAKDLAPVTNLLRVPLILAVKPDVPAHNLQELIAYIKSKKGDFQFASSGNGTPQHLAGEFADTGSEDVGTSPEPFGTFIAAEREKWGAVVKASGAHID